MNILTVQELGLFLIEERLAGLFKTLLVCYAWFMFQTVVGSCPVLFSTVHLTQ